MLYIETFRNSASFIQVIVISRREQS